MESLNQFEELAKLFQEKLKIKEQEEYKQKEQKRMERKEKRDKGEPVSDDTSEDEDDKLSPTDKLLKNLEREVQQLELLKKNAEVKFTYQKLINGLKSGEFKKIVVVTGAGISVSAGIPDFRSPNTGLYANLSQYNLPRPESMFDIEYFQEHPQAFYHLAKEFLDLDKFNPTPTHHFIKLLQDKGILQINMSQNIDNLEEKTGLDMEKRVVQAHGANNGATCSRCKQPQDQKQLKLAIKNQKIMRCKLDYTYEVETIQKLENGEEKKITVNTKELCNGPVKPNIVFFGEKLPEKFHWGWDRIRNKKMWSLELEPKDLFEDGGCDLVIVIGTALAVFPFCATPTMATKECPKVLINMENLAHNGYDFDDLLNYPERLLIQGKCDDQIKNICKDLGWTDQLNVLIEKADKKFKQQTVQKTFESNKQQVNAQNNKKVIQPVKNQAKVLLNNIKNKNSQKDKLNLKVNQKK